MALSTSFSGGWFFLGQFFDHAVGGPKREENWEVGRRGKRRSTDDVIRSRGRFQVFVTADEIISDLAQKLVNEDSEGAVLRALKEAIEENNIDWDPDFLEQLLDARERLPAWQQRLDRKAEQAKAAWFARRKRGVH